MIATLAIAAFAAFQVQVNSSTKRDSTGTSVTIGVHIGPGDSSSTFRIPVTAAHLATAFKDPFARTFLANARKARFRQDSALRTYDVKVYQRMSIGVALRAGRDRLAARDEAVARVQYDSHAGAVVDMLGKRTTVPIVYNPDQPVGDGTRTEVLPIPYFPGRETLWMGSSVARENIEDDSWVHPLGVGAEAYYTYATGDSIDFTLPDDRHVKLRELRMQAREPRWNAIVGSFWFDQSTSQLVRAVYRPSIDMDIWQVAMDEAQRDSSGDAPPGWVRGLVSPLTLSMEVFTVEYSLFEGRFWLPVSQSAEGRAQASFVRIPAVEERRFVYANVNDSVGVIAPMKNAPPAPVFFDARPLRDSLSNAKVPRARADSIVNARRTTFDDSLPRSRRRREVRDSLRATGLKPNQVDSVLSARATASAEASRKACAAAPDSTVVRHIRRYGGTLDVLVRTPCDLQTLRKSSELPASPYQANEETFGATDRAELTKALDFGLQAGWSPQKVIPTYGLSQSRYNRVEGFSTGLALTQTLGQGYDWSASIRAGQGDKQVNGELGIERSNGRTNLRFNAFRRLVSAGDWGEPLTLSASLPGLLYADDEGMYYRTWGAEIVRAPSAGNRVTLRAFVERQSSAKVTTRFSVFGGSHDSRFIANVDAETGTFAGAALRWRPAWGLSPSGWRSFADVRLEGAGGTAKYGRGALDLTVTHPIIGPYSFAITGSAGSSIGDLPAQREWFLGGAQTVRGEPAATMAGNAFWFGRGELARGKGGMRTSLFGDVGWAGPRTGDFGKSERLMSAVGVGWSLLDGLVRFDLARGLWPKHGWDFGLTVDARF